MSDSTPWDLLASSHPYTRKVRSREEPAISVIATCVFFGTPHVRRSRPGPDVIQVPEIAPIGETIVRR